MGFEFTHQAEIDLEEISLYLKNNFPAKLASTYHQIKAACGNLVHYPKAGRIGRIPETREYVLPDLPYIIVYRATHHRITVLRIYHTARRPLTD